MEKASEKRSDIEWSEMKELEARIQGLIYRKCSVLVAKASVYCQATTSYMVDESHVYLIKGK